MKRKVGGAGLRGGGASEGIEKDNHASSEAPFLACGRVLG